ncbi:hypothetical protein M0Q97_07600 [Candidatus Dojkabacteria bacterium]|jgi:hypothetical protein|nr:hypothetical protein [Candidatus Dojkabacteria bacterium]
MKTKTQEEIEKIIQDKLDDINYENTQTRMLEEYYMKNDAKIQVLEEILRLITN